MKLTVVCARFKEINYEIYRTEYWTKHIELTEEQIIEIGDVGEIYQSFLEWEEEITVVCARFKEINYEIYRTEYWTKHIELTEEQIIEIGDVGEIYQSFLEWEEEK